jgi:predicted O-methyltransferase YrrM
MPTKAKLKGNSVTIGVFRVLIVLLLCASISIRTATCAETSPNNAHDEKVRNFLEKNKDRWQDWNIPYADGKILYDLILKNGYTRALEIGTSTGHSAIWMAWALSKTGGKLTTIEIDEGRHRQALANFKEAGLSNFIDARLADAHDLVPELKGPYDFVFSDADKEWYKNYFMLLAPKLAVGGAFTAHNASNRTMRGVREFLDYVEGLPNYRTRIDTTSRAGISISIKTAPD